MRDCLGRAWQCGTIQVDFQMPGRLGAEYVAEDNSRKVPVMLHRAILGSLERWIGMLIEALCRRASRPWLAPVQVRGRLHYRRPEADYADEVAAKLQGCPICACSQICAAKRLTIKSAN